MPIRLRCVRDYPHDTCRLERMLDQRIDHFGRVSAALPLGKDGVADFHRALFVRRTEVASGRHKRPRTLYICLTDSIPAVPALNLFPAFLESRAKEHHRLPVIFSRRPIG